MLADDYAGDALNVNGPIIRDLTEIIQYRTIENQSINQPCVRRPAVLLVSGRKPAVKKR